MKVLVLGAGVAGVSSAWYLAEAGHEVTVIDRAEGVAMETSFANAGQLSYGYTTPWAAPGIPTKALKWLFKSHPPLLFRPERQPVSNRMVVANAAKLHGSALSNQ